MCSLRNPRNACTSMQITRMTRLSAQHNNSRVVELHHHAFMTISFPGYICRCRQGQGLSRGAPHRQPIFERMQRGDGRHDPAEGEGLPSRLPPAHHLRVRHLHHVRVLWRPRLHGGGGCKCHPLPTGNYMLAHLGVIQSKSTSSVTLM